MTMSEVGNAVVRDLALFADLGTDPPRAVEYGGRTVVRIVRNGSEVEIILQPDGPVTERNKDEDIDRHHLDLRALIASPNFGDLGRWADSQRTFLRDRVSRETIPIFGTLSGRAERVDLDSVDDVIVPDSDSKNPNVHILLVDGPAGIGKTSLIRALAFRRADGYREHRRPLILHVESRGRVLQNIMDLMAFSLQTLRLNVTYDQVPALIRHGLVTLAIDGFDELGDPNGYELAWAQVNELVADVRGQGSVLLAGRETFIGRERLVAALKSFRFRIDKLNTYTLQPIMPATAKRWLRERGWTDSVFQQDNVVPLFETGSYALRPFFLDELAKEGVPEQIEKGEVVDLTWFLVETMIHREATKFGKEVEAVTTEHMRTDFVRRFLGEVARDLAENQTEAIAAESLAWIAEIVASETLPRELVGIVKNRASVVAFLTDDDRRGYKRFSHVQLLNHFLARITIDTVISGEVPKYVRRNIFGAGFLLSFVDVARNCTEEQIISFAKSAISRIGEFGDQDRSRRNLAALVLAVVSIMDGDAGLELDGIAIDEALIVETAGALDLKNVTIAQLDVRGADIRRFSFDPACHVVSLIADSGTMLPLNFPCPFNIQVPEKVIPEPTEIRHWLRAHSEVGQHDDSAADVIPGDVRGDALLELVGRVSRYKPFWLKHGDEKAARRILDDQNWERLRDILEEHDLLLTRRNIGAGGKPSRFYHVRRKSDILAEQLNDSQIADFYRGVVAAIHSTKS